MSVDKTARRRSTEGCKPIGDTIQDLAQ